ncbi:MAG: DUF475 domain-containing protein [Chitinophagales bacterium]
MDHFINFLHQYLGADLKVASIVILNLILIESLLSIDNAAVLATMVMKLPQTQRVRALRIGVLFAYLFRGAFLVFANLLIKISWLKLIGGGYLIYLCVHFFIKNNQQHQNILEQEKEVTDEAEMKKDKFRFLSLFWRTVLLVEVMDLTFSLDNVFAAVAFTSNIYLVCLGVFIGIITMRIVTAYFVKLMERFPFLDRLAFVIIGILGMKLVLEFLSENFIPALHPYIKNERADLYFSLFTVAIFFIPILVSLLIGKKASSAE